MFFPIAIATMVGIRSVDGRLLELGRSLRATRRQVLTTLEIPAALPSIFGGMRLGVTLAVVGAIVGEWAGASKGLAVLINLARGSLFDIPLMFATLRVARRGRLYSPSSPSGGSSVPVASQSIGGVRVVHHSRSLSHSDARRRGRERLRHGVARRLCPPSDPRPRAAASQA